MVMTFTLVVLISLTVLVVWDSAEIANPGPTAGTASRSRASGLDGPAGHRSTNEIGDARHQSTDSPGAQSVAARAYALPRHRVAPARFVGPQRAPSAGSQPAMHDHARVHSKASLPLA